jgi:hypothetical protein
VEEESDLGAREPLAEEGGECKQVVVMDPDEVIVGVEHLGEAIDEGHVHGEEGVVEGAIEW